MQIQLQNKLLYLYELVLSNSFICWRSVAVTSRVWNIYDSCYQIYEKALHNHVTCNLIICISKLYIYVSWSFTIATFRKSLLAPASFSKKSSQTLRYVKIKESNSTSPEAVAIALHTNTHEIFGVANVLGKSAVPAERRPRHCQLWRNPYDLPTRIGQSKPDCVNMCHVSACRVNGFPYGNFFRHHTFSVGLENFDTHFQHLTDTNLFAVKYLLFLLVKYCYDNKNLKSKVVLK